MTRSVSDRSGSTTDAPAAASSSALWIPEATAMISEPVARAASTSRGVSPDQHDRDVFTYAP
ncbi:hypothetical protein PL81_22120 [Streptomyces sp. RSD-27]|nr:hypothetical protein PL81_22120 [Streptomyces sp. RSD-27]